ncbi:hypothetical protein IAD21_02781 [Abditibacteriota bacterium]|nr:hypothetical protein IAD21_02781 [Abditibacteriota bacterium]
MGLASNADDLMDCPTQMERIHGRYAADVFA